MSRNQANDKIADGLVSVNSLCATKPTLTIKANDKISIRQKGKFEITTCDELSKKGRIILEEDLWVNFSKCL